MKPFVLQLKIYNRGGEASSKQQAVRDEPRAVLREVWLVITLVFFLPTSIILTSFLCRHEFPHSPDTGNYVQILVVIVKMVNMMLMALVMRVVCGAGRCEAD